MHEKHKTRDPVDRLDEIVAELGRLYAEADRLIDDYAKQLPGEARTAPRPDVAVRRALLMN